MMTKYFQYYLYLCTSSSLSFSYSSSSSTYSSSSVLSVSVYARVKHCPPPLVDGLGRDARHHIHIGKKKRKDHSFFFELGLEEMLEIAIRSQKKSHFFCVDGLARDARGHNQIKKKNHIFSCGMGLEEMLEITRRSKKTKRTFPCGWALQRCSRSH
jgi:hypothetical protein